MPMQHALDRLLATYRDAARTERDKGTYFERLAVAYLLNDPVQAELYEAVWPYAEWAKVQGLDGRDTGIDLVAKLRDEEGFAAIQCKFYDATHRIQKADIDSFMSASGKAHFKRRIIIDTTDAEWSANAEDMLRGQTIPTLRINLTDLRESPIDWAAFGDRGEVKLAPRKIILPHQSEALEAVRDGLRETDRGKLIMACGTGKTFTSLKIAEDMVGAGGIVLFLMPSLALMAQSVREWTNDAAVPLRSFAVCSDTQVGKRRTGNADIAEIDVLDLAFPATTDAARLVEEATVAAPDKMTVIFATYQSIQVISNAQKAGLPRFDLIICDEAHRTTGATLSGEDSSNFLKVHSEEFIQGRKRLYMTATPRIFGDSVKSKADQVDAVLASMDDEELFGKTLFYRGFSWAVQNGLLTDYKVIVLAMDEGLVSSAIQRRLGDGTSELVLDDATKIIGCYKALTKKDLKLDVEADPLPMHRALAFCRDIKSSKLVANEFAAVVAEYLGSEDAAEGDGPEGALTCEIEHVDGTFNAKTRSARLDWLKGGDDANACRILTNARCLSEGVDVPSLDAIMFLHPRKSQIDVVQSVGRVMRRAEGKKMGYVILPVGVPAGVPPEQALNDNEKYRVVWQILNALRAHDDRFDATINKASLGQDVSGKIEIVGVTRNPELEAVTAVVQDLPARAQPARSNIGAQSREGNIGASEQGELAFSVDEFSRAIMAKIVKKCGTRDYWEDWATNIAEIAKNHITRLTVILQAPETPARPAFDAFLAELKDDLNDTVSESDAIEMLAQHIITRPVFETLFEGHKFTSENPVSRAMQSVLDVLNEQNLDKEARDLEKFYASVRARAEGLTEPQAKQRLIVELYDKFFRRAFPRTTEKLGIVYTPVEVVDFIIHSVNEVLKSEFGQTLGSEDVHIIDPFTGTGTFITRLLQSGLIAPEEMERKYRHEIHANEIVLLAYYIAAINIEAVYHGIMDGDYVPFEGICLTDTFQMYEKADLISHYMLDNSARRERQKSLDIRVILGNPPYSVGQKSANDDAKNVTYAGLRRSLQKTYIDRSNSNARSVYDTYILSIRWATDRLKNSGRGVIAFVSGNGFIDKPAMDGMRRCLAEEFSTLYVVNLRGDVRKNMLSKGMAREGGNVFDSGSMTGIAISFLVKNPDAKQLGKIRYFDVGDDLGSLEKRTRLSELGSIGSIEWTDIEPNEQADWINQRDLGFSKFLAIGDKQKREKLTLFENFSLGIATNRDAWCVNYSVLDVANNMERMISVYEHELDKFATSEVDDPDKVFSYDDTKISWSHHLKKRFKAHKRSPFSSENVKPVLYRPFIKEWIYYDKLFNEYTYQSSKIFGDGDFSNLAIMVSGTGARSGFSALMIDRFVSGDLIEKGQCFPLHLLEVAGESGNDLFSPDNVPIGYRARDGITDDGVAYFHAAYPAETIGKEDIFYYVYGLLHSEDYRTRYADNLSKELPRIPCVKKAEDFWRISNAGRDLAELHVNYESVAPWPVTIKEGDLRLADIKKPESFYRVTKMKFGKAGKKVDKSTVIYNANITMQDIPLEAYGYVVNGKPALEWVIERQVVKTDKDSGIVNDANRYAVETVGNPAYPLELFQRVITVSMETLKIVRGLPKLELPE